MTSTEKITIGIGVASLAIALYFVYQYEKQMIAMQPVAVVPPVPSDLSSGALIERYLESLFGGHGTGGTPEGATQPA